MSKVNDRIDLEMSGVHWVASSKELAFTPAPVSLTSKYDLAVVGAGYCGLSIALEAAQIGLKTVLLDAGIVGCGASGRNGGIVVPTLPGARTPSYLEAQYGKRRAAILIDLVQTGPDFVFERARRHQINCDVNAAGWIQPAHTKKTLAGARDVFEDWAARGANVSWLDQDEVKNNLGAEGYLGGWRSASGGTVNPWALAQGLARAAEAAGAHIKERAAVHAIKRGESANLLITSDETISASKVVIATNGYTSNLVSKLQDSVIPVRLFHCLTRPLSEEERVGILPKGRPFTDLRKSGGFCRFDADGRLMSGGAVFTASNARRYGLNHARQRIAELFPKLAGIEIEKYWEGWCALREEFLPIAQAHGEDVYSLLGFSTRGVALTQTLGHAMARFLNESLSEQDMPIPVVAPNRIPLRALKQELGGWAFPVYQLRDRFRV